MTATKVIEGVGEVGIDSEASPGNGPYYVRLYNGKYHVVGFDTEAEALEMVMNGDVDSVDMNISTIEGDESYYQVEEEEE